MTDHDLRIRQQRGKLFYIALIVEDRGVQRRLHLGENSRPDRGGEMAKKQGFHMLPLPTHDSPRPQHHHRIHLRGRPPLPLHDARRLRPT
jgi:hypothetical protein